MVDLGPRRLPGTELDIGRVVLGTTTFGTELDEASCERAVHRARDFGVTMFDSSNSYGQGRAETILGRVVKPFREQVQVTSKVGSYRTATDPHAPRLDRDSILRACDESLGRLDTDYIDVYYLHMPDPRTPLEESMAACQELLDAGKIRYCALSNFAAWQVVDAIRLADAHSWPRVRISQPMYNLLARRVEEEYIACTQHFDISNITFNALAGGLLTGKHRQDTGPAEGTRFALYQSYVDRYWNQSQFEAVARLKAIADGAGLTLMELAMRWLLSRPAVDGVLVGVTSLEQLEANLAAVDGPAPDDSTIAAIDDVWSALRGPAPAYNF